MSVGSGSEARAAQRVRNLYLVWGRIQSLVGTARPEVGCPELGVACTLFSLERDSFGGQSWGSRGPCKRPPPRTTAAPREGGQPEPCPKCAHVPMASDTGDKARSQWWQAKGAMCHCPGGLGGLLPRPGAGGSDRWDPHPDGSEGPVIPSERPGTCRLLGECSW